MKNNKKLTRRKKKEFYKNWSDASIARGVVDSTLGDTQCAQFSQFLLHHPSSADFHKLLLLLLQTKGPCTGWWCIRSSSWTGLKSKENVPPRVENKIIIIIENAENSLTKEKARRRSAIKFMHVYPPPSLDHLWIPLRNDDVCPKMGYHRCHSLNADGAMPNPFWVAVISSNRIWCLQLCTVVVLWATI